MAFAVVLYFDEAADQVVRTIQEKLASSSDMRGGFAGTVPPHISLGACQGITPESFRAPLAQFARHASATPFELASVGTFATRAGIVFLAPVVTRALLNLHERFSDLFGGYAASPSSHYLPGRWVPHCTVALDVPDENVPQAFDLCRKAELPIRGRYERIGLVQFPPNGELYSFHLGQH